MNIDSVKAVLNKTAFFFVFIICLPQFSTAQELKEVGKNFKINKVIFEGNDYFSSSVLEQEISTKQNSYLFSHSIKPGLWNHYFIDFVLTDYLFSSFELKKFKTYLLNNFTEEPSKFNYVNFQDDISYLKSYYSYFGFFETQVDTSVQIDGEWLDIGFKITEGQRSKIASLNYNFLTDFPGDKAEEIIKNTTIESGDWYSVFDIKTERDRIVTKLQDFGYSFTTEDSVQVIADSSTYPNLNINFSISPSLLAKVNTQSMYINTFKEDDTTSISNQYRTFSGNVNVYSTDYGDLDPEILIKHTDLESGNIYTPNNRTSSLRNLGELGVFRTADLRIDSVIINKDNTYSVFPRYDFALAPKHEIRPEIRLDSKSSGSFGADLIYINNNTFHSAENMRFKIGGSIQIPFWFLSGSNSVSTYQEWSVDTGVDFSFPYFFGTRNKSQISFKAQRASKSQYNYTNITAGLKLEYKHNAVTRSYFDLWELNWVDATNQYFSNVLRENFIYRPYLNSIFRWTIQRVETDPILKNYGSSRELLYEESGLIPRLVAATVKSANGIQDSTTGRIFDLDYYQYSKIQGDFRWYVPTSPSTVIAYKIILGYMTPYGVSNQTPSLSRFIVGGPTSLRGWFPASIGPGNSQANSLNGYADIKFEGSVEYRKNWGESWGTSFFTDFGNVWNRNGNGAFVGDRFFKEIAIDYGVGVKYFLPIGPVRLDFAWKAYDPSLAEADRFVLKKFRVGEIWDKISIYFGIGHAF